MNLIDKINLLDPLHAISQSLLVPVVLLLILMVAYTVYTLGSLVVEYFVERRHYRVVVPTLIERIDDSDVSELPAIIDESGLLGSQRDVLHELVRLMGLPEDALTEVARDLLRSEAVRYQRGVSRSEAVSRVAPMLGLMGTLIPLGPGILALSDANLDLLSQSLLIAFDTTILGLAVAVVMFLITKARKRWYKAYLADIEGLMVTLIEKAGGAPDTLASSGSAVGVPEADEGELVPSEESDQDE